jgi:hypothetical protein
MNHIFPDIRSVSQQTCKSLQKLGVLNPNDTLVSWERLSPKMVSREITHDEAKCLVLLELKRHSEPRAEILRRLVNYISYHGKEQTMKNINKHLNKWEESE